MDGGFLPELALLVVGKSIPVWIICSCLVKIAKVPVFEPVGYLVVIGILIFGEVMGGKGERAFHQYRGRGERASAPVCQAGIPSCPVPKPVPILRKGGGERIN